MLMYGLLKNKKVENTEDNAHTHTHTCKLEKKSNKYSIMKTTKLEKNRREYRLIFWR